MIKVKLSTSSPHWPLERQTPGGNGEWGNCKFYINRPVDDCDYWVVFGGLTGKESTRCPRENTIFITTEPPTVKQYSPKFLNQFGLIITCQRQIVHHNVIYSQQGLPWMIGGKYLRETHSWAKEFSKDYDELINIKEYRKNKLMAIVLSNKSLTEGHSKRLEFVYRLKEHLGAQLDIFGAGINKIEDKWDALADYKYHLAIENSAVPDYWTEKLADAFLAGAYPFYYGCPNIFDYFAEGSLTLIDINDPEGSIRIIGDTIKNRQYENSIEKINGAKHLILNKFNLFSMLSTYCNEVNLSKSVTSVFLKPEENFLPKPTRLRYVITRPIDFLFKLYQRLRDTKIEPPIARKDECA